MYYVGKKMGLRTVASVATIAGLAITMLAIGFYFQLERHSFETTIDRQFVFLERAWLPTLEAGIAIAILGSLMWGWCLQSARRFALAGILFVSGWPLMFLGGLGVHNWVGSFLFVGLGLHVSSILLTVLALILKFLKFPSKDRTFRT